MITVCQAEPERDIPEEEAWDLETALDHVGVGRFQWTALAVCGLANAADAVEILGLSLVLPAAEDDLSLTAAGKSALSSSIFAGMLLGGLVWGPMGDALGRRMTLVVSLVINAAFGMLSAAAQGVWVLVVLRFLAGVGVGGSVPVVFSFLAELLPAKARGKFMVGLAAHWMVGSIYAAGIGWVLIPTAGWRAFLVVAALPAWLAAAGTLLLLPESPRHLLVHGKLLQAEQAIGRMAAVNKVRLPPNMKLQQHESHLLNTPAAAAAADGHGQSAQHSTHSIHSLAALEMDVGSKDVHAATGYSSARGSAAAAAALGNKSTWLQQAMQALQSTGATAMQLLQPPLRARFWPLLVAWIGMCGGWYSTVLWIPEYFKARGTASTSLYAETFAVAAANLPGNIASIFMVDWLGRRLTACVCLAGACAAALGFAAAPADPVWSVVAACVFNAISVGGWNALDLLSTELFPTEVRSTAMGLLGATGRLASFTTTYLAGALMGLKLWAPLVVAAALLAAGSIAMMLLPEMAHKPLEDTVEDAAARSSGTATTGSGDDEPPDAGLRPLSLRDVITSLSNSLGDGLSSNASAVRRRSSHLMGGINSASTNPMSDGIGAQGLAGQVLGVSHSVVVQGAGGSPRFSSRGGRGLEMAGVSGAAMEEGRSLLPTLHAADYGPLSPPAVQPA